MNPANMTPATHNYIDTFQECVEAINEGRATTDSCVALHSEFVELRDMLLSVQAMDRLAALSMPTERKAAIAQQLTERIQKGMSQPKRGFRSFRLPLTFTLAACVLVFFVVGLFYFLRVSTPDNTLNTGDESRPTAEATIERTSAPTSPATLSATESPTDTVVPVTFDMLRAKMRECLINKNLYNSFSVKLNARQLRAFINEVRAQSGKKLGADCAKELIAMANQLNGK
jgi:hypothetical protein